MPSTARRTRYCLAIYYGDRFHAWVDKAAAANPHACTRATPRRKTYDRRGAAERLARLYEQHNPGCTVRPETI